MPTDRSDPFQELVKLRELFYELFGRSFSEHFSDEGPAGIQWSPLVDIYQTEEEIEILMEIPGLERDDIQIEFLGSRVIIKGERGMPFPEGQASVHRLERQHGHFERVIDLPIAIEASEISAEYTAGVLAVKLPMHSNKKPRKIPVENKK
ncbi:MAG: Hsp20/alpha crystallin family protein [Deltaproteobacteria bacterium]|nr:Hsp20/alpha crystallin family protein [Deltaproteobacteria bacterium]